MMPTMPAPHRRTRMRVSLGQLCLGLAAACALGVLSWRHLHPPAALELALLPEPTAVLVTSASASAAAVLAPAPDYQTASLLISYGYFEKDDLQVSNFEFFLAAGMKASESQPIHWCLVISTPHCWPCRALSAKLSAPEPGPPGIGIATVRSNADITMLQRTENVGMDVALHNITLEYMTAVKRIWSYKYFFFINSSTKGPFFPAYMPALWHWTHAYLARFTSNIHAVASSLTCLPDIDAGGPGPRLESWAYAVDVLGLKAMLLSGSLHIRTCKLCEDDSKGIVVGGEYGITLSQFKAGYNVATLMKKYRVGIDWRDRYHWNCNNNVHASRHGTYDGIAQHPFETVFVKSSWHVGDPYTQRYARWQLAHLDGTDGTEGEFDALMYHYGVCPEAQAPNLLEAAYNVSSYRNFFRKGGGAAAAIAAGAARRERGKVGR